MKNKRKQSFFFMFLLIFLIVICAVTYAYYADHHAKINAFTTGSVSISLTEPKYNLPENVQAREDLAPRQPVVKDPKVTNTGTSDAFVFLVVDLPRTNRTLIDAKGQKLPEDYRDMFDFNVNAEWVPVSDEVLTLQDGKPYHRFVYGYAAETGLTGKMMPLKSKAVTPALFKNDELVFRNFIETADKEPVEIPVTAYAIQTTDILTTDGVKDTGETVPAEVWKVINTQLKAEKGGR